MNTRPTGDLQYDNAGRVVVVTGAGRGIGWEICHQFQRSGAQAICLDVDRSAVDRLPRGVEFHSLDTSDHAACRQTITDIVRRHEGIDILVNNAAIQPPESYEPIHDYPKELWDRMVAVNLSGYTNMAQAVLPTMIAQRSGVIVNMASGQGHRTARGVGAYGPIKAANIMQSRQWGVEYARCGVRVVSISPGAIDTPLVRSTLDAQGGEAELANRHPIGRIGHPREVAAAVLWLCSPAASFVTATDLEVDGGLGAFGAFADPFPPGSP